VAVLRVLAEDRLIERAALLGTALADGVEALNHPLVDHVRGRGLLFGIVLNAPHAKAVETAARAAGFLLNAAAPDVIRLAPPLIITADIVTLAKGLAGGLPIGACLAIGPAAELMTPGMHGSTFGGNPICTAAAVAVLRVLAEDGLIERAALLGTALADGVEAVNHPLVDHVRGRGLLFGIVLNGPHAKAVETAARAAGFLVNAAAPDVIRLAPPLIITAAQVDDFLAALPGILDAGVST
jgi:acetylornithine/succinyldiaminopimelate/putrescine aminotransferase